MGKFVGAKFWRLEGLSHILSEKKLDRNVAGAWRGVGRRGRHLENI